MSCFFFTSKIDGCCSRLQITARSARDPLRLAEFRSESVCEKNDAASRIVLLLARSSIKGFVIS